MGFKRVFAKVLTVGTARWLIFRYGLDALAIGQCGSLHHLQRVLLWFKWGPPRRTMLLDHLPLVFPQRWDLLLTWKHWHHLQLRKQTMFAPFCTSTLLFKLRFMYITSTYNTVRRLLNPMFSYPKRDANHFKMFSLRLAIYLYVFLQEHGKSPHWTSYNKSLPARWSKHFPQTLPPHQKENYLKRRMKKHNPRTPPKTPSFLGFANSTWWDM